MWKSVRLRDLEAKGDVRREMNRRPEVGVVTEGVIDGDLSGILCGAESLAGECSECSECMRGL